MKKVLHNMHTRCIIMQSTQLLEFKGRIGYAVKGDRRT